MIIQKTIQERQHKLQEHLVTQLKFSKTIA